MDIKFFFLYYYQFKLKITNMAPPNTDAIIQEIEKLNLQQVAREKGHYLVYPDTLVCIFYRIVFNMFD
jgi:hypothetical protein